MSTIASVVCRYGISFALGLALTCTVAQSAFADNVYWQPHVQVGGGHDSNPRMAYDTPTQHEEPSALFQSQVDSELGIESGTNKSTLFGRYWYQSTEANHDYDADIIEWRGDFTHTTETSALTANVDAIYDTTLTSEFEESGRSLNEKKDHRNFNGKLGYQWRLTELDQIGLNASASESRYINAESVGLNDYDTTQYDTTYARTISERSSGGLQLTYSEFNIPKLAPVEGQLSQLYDMSYDTENYIAALFGQYAISERDSISWQLGFRSSKFYQEGGPFIFKDEGTGRVFSTKYQHKFESTQFQLSAARDVRPTSAGRIVEQDSIDVVMRRDLSERMAISTSLSANREREPVQQAGADRDYAQAFIGLRYSVSEQHSLALELLERWQRYDGVDEIKAQSTGIFLRWYWTPTQVRWR